MTDQLTRQQLLRRAAVGGAAITVPGLLAACGSSGTKAAGRHDQRRAEAREARCTSRTGRSTSTSNKKTKTHPSLDAFQKKTGVNVNYVEDINDNAVVLREDPGPALARPVDRPRHHRPHRQRRATSALMIEKGWAEKLDKSAIPNIKNLRRRPAAPELRPEPRLHACRGSRA